MIPNPNAVARRVHVPARDERFAFQPECAEYAAATERGVADQERDRLLQTSHEAHSQDGRGGKRYASPLLSPSSMFCPTYTHGECFIQHRIRYSLVPPGAPSTCLAWALLIQRAAFRACPRFTFPPWSRPNVYQFAHSLPTPHTTHPLWYTLRTQHEDGSDLDHNCTFAPTINGKSRMWCSGLIKSFYGVS